MPALHRSPLARWLVPGAMGRPGEDGSIGRPEAPIGFKPPTGGFASVSHDAGHDRPRPSGPPAPRNSQDVPPWPAARSRLPEDERRLPDRPDGDPIQPRPSPQADPLRIGPPNRLLLCLRIPPLGLQDPIGPTGLAGILRVPVSIPSLLDDVPTPASAAPVSPGLRNPGTPPREDSLYDTSLTKRSIPTFQNEGEYYLSLVTRHSLLLTRDSSPVIPVSFAQSRRTVMRTARGTRRG